MTNEQKTDRKLLMWFLVTLLIAIIPWFISPSQKASKKENSSPVKREQKKISEGCA